MALTLLGPWPWAQAQQTTGAECRVHWEVSAQLDRPTPSLTVQMSFDAGTRTITHLRLPGGWQAVEPDPGSAAMLSAVADNPPLRQVRHAAGQRVQLQWQYTPPLAGQAGGALLTERWFAFTAGTVLPWPEEAGAALPATPVCVSLAGPAGGTRLISSFGSSSQARAQWTVSIGPSQWPRSLFAGGAWQVREAAMPGQALTVAMPDKAPFGFGVDALARSAAETLGALRKPWGSPESAPLLLLMLPNASAPAGLALHQALVVQAPPALPLPSERFDELLAGPWLRGWLPERLGPLAYQGRGDATLRAWFSEGLADFLAHRWLLREARWTPADYAAALNRKISRYQALPELDASNLRVATGAAGDHALAVLPAARGEFLALAWHQALLRAGQAGLEPVLYGLVLPAAQARPEGPTSAPLATHRLVAALRRSLADMPLKTIGQHIDEGLPFNFGPQTLGPCFHLQGSGTPAQYRPVEQAQERADCRAWITPVGPALELAALPAGAAPLAATAAAAMGRVAGAAPLPRAGASALAGPAAGGPAAPARSEAARHARVLPPPAARTGRVATASHRTSQAAAPPAARRAPSAAARPGAPAATAKASGKAKPKPAATASTAKPVKQAKPAKKPGGSNAAAQPPRSNRTAQR